MNQILLDTDILSEVLKGRDANVVAKAKAYRKVFTRYTLSTITVLEIVKGFQRLQRHDRIQSFLSAIATEDILTLDMSSAEIAGRIHGDLERMGQPAKRIR
jgi:tRNA(fMet)-specific endonuclease VapC